MQKLTNSGLVEQDSWKVLSHEDAELLQEAPVNCLVPSDIYLKKPDLLTKNTANELWLNPEANLEELTDAISLAQVIAIHFPVFADGRGFSLARSLRDQYRFSGELIAIGNFMQDQLFYLKRCGFSSFALKETDNVESMRLSLADFSEAYQAACDQPKPLFKRKI